MKDILTELEELEAKGTPGPWEVQAHYGDQDMKAWLSAKEGT